MQAVPVVTLQNTPLPSEAQGLLEQLTSTEGRLGVSLGILIVTLLIGVAIAPFIVRRVATYTKSALPAGRASDGLDRMTEYVPTTLSGLFLRVLQLVLLLTAVVSLLVVWGLVDLAVDVLRLLGLSIPLLANVVTTIAIGLISYIASDILRDSVERLSTDSDRVTEHQTEIILRVGNISIIALFLASALTIWGVDLSGLLVGAGFLGIVVGLAARQTLGSLIAGFVLMFSRPFTIGDWVEIGDQEGVVTEITIVNTRLENFDGETIVLPNDMVSNKSIINRSERGHHRIRLDVGIDYATDPDRAIDVAQEAIADLKPVSDSPPPRIVPKSFGDSAVVLEMRFWIDNPMPPRKWRAISAVVRSVREAYAAADIKIPFPQQELSGRAETGGFRVNEETIDRQDGEERSVEPSAEE
ncbi:mechanosensitive ion channel family protein [Salinibaculum rarum]|uniref:mechanosensitive ion channel family protein n=1 Tax=Salinibaculum rarum TaxID=3058903 RepID=UPI00265E1473|nr:mechanosensitive ion channel family protein [Salinibaculum sp. KK48]